MNEPVAFGFDMDEIIARAYALLFRAAGTVLIVAGIVLIIIALRVRRKRRLKAQALEAAVNMPEDRINGFYVEQEIYYSDGSPID